MFKVFEQDGGSISREGRKEEKKEKTENAFAGSFLAGMWYGERR
jgi:hypothetical protein